MKNPGTNDDGYKIFKRVGCENLGFGNVTCNGQVDVSLERGYNHRKKICKGGRGLKVNLLTSY